MRKILLFALAILVQQPAHGIAAAQVAPQSESEVLGRPDQIAILAALKKAITANYPDRRQAADIVSALTAHERKGRYSVADPKELGIRLDQDLPEAGKDKHLGVKYNPSLAARLQSPAPSGLNPAMQAFLTGQARRGNHGLREMRVYPGNVRYLRVSTFSEWIGDESAKAYDHAMKFLAGGDAVILDLRGNGGGVANAYTYLISHFVEPGTVLYTSVMRGKREAEIRAAADLPAGRLLGKPLWVLSDSKAASATEAFLHDTRHRQLGQIVGEKSNGAANHNQFFALPKGLVASISIGGPIMATTNSNWERVGIAPHVDTPSELALQTALLLAQEKLASNSPPELKPLAENEVQKLRDELRKAEAAHAAARKAS